MAVTLALAGACTIFAAGDKIAETGTMSARQRALTAMVDKHAKAQILVIDALLKDSAAQAKSIVAKFKPRYPSIKAYLKATDEFFLDCEAVTYDKNGEARVKFK